MKKAYVTPKIEKMAFNYSDAVVASNTNKCYNSADVKYWVDNCNDDTSNYHWVDDQGPSVG